MCSIILQASYIAMYFLEHVCCTIYMYVYKQLVMITQEQKIYE